jgi:hypothetical protein
VELVEKGTVAGFSSSTSVFPASKQEVAGKQRKLCYGGLISLRLPPNIVRGDLVKEDVFGMQHQRTLKNGYRILVQKL